MANTETPSKTRAVVITPKEENKLVGVNAGDPTPPSSTDTKILVHANYSILNSNLGATFFYKGKKKGYSILVAPENPKQTSGSSSLKDIVDAVDSIGGKKEDVDKALKNWGVQEALEKITLSLDMAFLYIDKGEDQTPPAKNEESSKKVEYAFQVSLDNASDLIPAEISSLFTFENVKLSIWNTEREKILNEMHLKTPNQILTEWDSPNK